jgi:hypothetical protein
VYDAVKAELAKRGGYIMSPEECKKAGTTIIKDGRLNAGARARVWLRVWAFVVAACGGLHGCDRQPVVRA